MKQTLKTDKSYVVMVGNKQMQITQSLDMRKSALLTFADSRKKRSPKLQKSASSQSPKRALGGNNRMTSKPSLELHKSASSAATDATPNKDSRMAMKRSSKMLKSSSSRGKNRMNKKQSLELQKSPALLSPEECPKQKRLSSPASLSPHAITKKYSRMNKSEFQQSPRTASSAENFRGSQEEFSPISSPDMNYNSDIRLSLSPLYSAAPGDESPGSPGIYRMTRQRSSEFHISPYTSSPESCISNKKRSIYDSTSDERRSRKKLLNLMNESYLRSASSSQPEDKDTFDFDTPTNSQKGTPQPTKTQKNCKAKAWNWTFDDWFAYKKKERQMEQQRKEQERASRDFIKARRKEISQGVYQMWLRNKQRELEAKRIQDHMQLAALTAQSSLKKNPIKVPVRNIPQDTINQELECWRLKKIEIQRAKRREQQLAALKNEEEIFNRQKKSEMALKKWFSTVHTKPKPVPMNQGVDSLRGTISKLYVNPQPWVAC
ncbi:uncharacterized protein LOC111076521 isoform X2 [Drosophila obscura]|uniref:uncharacterized protein LOC111076521 isoform X2 n=1 Tax=Drosophila obscura TaxID=7282 RepID=UPI001BB16395|nr:uncharacterized protein LOC111076521 isoform X2 [Drosophila obscura]